MKKKILIIEDDIDLGEETAELLESEGYEADFISDPFEAEKALDRGCDIVLLDYKMPGKDGTEIARLILEKKYRVKILVITGKPFIKKLFEEEGLLDAVEDFLVKPFDNETLLSRIKSL